jgi:hypothetical protein
MGGGDGGRETPSTRGKNECRGRGATLYAKRDRWKGSLHLRFQDYGKAVAGIYVEKSTGVCLGDMLLYTSQRLRTGPEG